MSTLPSWYKTHENFALRENDGGYAVHPFFDSEHQLNESSRELKFIIVTPEKSEFRYFLDLLSGRLVVDKKYCEQEDVWERTSDTLKLPPFNIGVIPRWLDTLGEPQEIIVFGRGGYYRKLDKSFSQTYSARIVGGINVQYCPRKMCRADDWVSNIIPVGVDPKDSDYSDVNTLDDLKSETNWRDVVLFLQNGKGRVLRSRKDIPSYRYLSEISAISTIKFLKEKAYEFKYEKMNRMRNACQNLYEYAWSSSNKLRKIEKKSDLEIIEEFKTKFFERNVYTKEQRDEDRLLTKAENFRNFARWFEQFYISLGKDFKTCSRYTRMGNFSVDREQFWFFVYLDLFFKMQDVGFIYNCDSLAWIKNYREMNGEWAYKQEDYLKKCSVSALDRGFETASIHMLDLQKNDLEHFRFVGYDNSLGGSHQMVYNWVNFSGKKFRCIDEEEAQENNQMISRMIFDQMTPWNRFSPKRNSLYDLIY